MTVRIFPQWISAPNSVTLFALITVLVSVILVAVIKRMKFVHQVNKIPGMPEKPVLGNSLVLLVSPEGTHIFYISFFLFRFTFVLSCAKEIFTRIIGYIYGMRSLSPILRAWAGPFPIILLFTSEAFEVN